MFNHAEKTKLESFLTEKDKICFVKGFIGTGKSYLIKNVVKKNVKNVFVYNASKITNFDDILLSLYRYLTAKKFIIKKYKSVDEAVLKTLEKLEKLEQSLIIVIDGFEKFAEPKEFWKFCDHVLEFDKLKIIVAGKLFKNGLKSEIEAFEIRLGGLDENEAKNFLKSLDLELSQSQNMQLYSLTRGYIQNLIWFNLAVKKLNISPFELMKEAFSYHFGFELFILKKFTENLFSDEYIELLELMSMIRHYVNVDFLETTEQLNFNPEKPLNELKELNFMDYNTNSFLLKELFANYIFDNISAEKKKHYHEVLQKLYVAQIPLKPKDRLIGISRKLLHSEQYYHFVEVSKLSDKGNSSLPLKDSFPNSGLGSEISQQDELTKLHLTEEELKLLEDSSKIVEPTPKSQILNPSLNLAINGITEDSSPSFSPGSISQVQNDTVVTIIEKKQDNPAESYFNKALEYDDNGETDRALEFYLKATMNDNPLQASAYTNIAMIYEERNNLEEAINYHKKSIATDRKNNDHKNIYYSLSSLGGLYTSLKNETKALQCFELALKEAKLSKDRYNIANANLELGDYYFTKLAYKRSLNHYILARESLKETISTDSLEKINRRFAKIIKRMGRVEFVRLLETGSTTG